MKLRDDHQDNFARYGRRSKPISGDRAGRGTGAHADDRRLSPPRAAAGALLTVLALLVLALPPAALAELSFSGPTDFAAGLHPESVAVGDFDGDSVPDLAVANRGGTVSILLGDGEGGFARRDPNFAAGTTTVSVGVGDFDGDADDDVAAANFGSHDVSVLLGDGAGGFAPATSFSTGVGGHPTSIAVGDFNRDSDPDLVVTNIAHDRVVVRLGSVGGTFTAPIGFDAGTSPDSVAVGDFDGNGYPDLAVTASFLGDVSVLLGDGSGGFGAPTSFPAGDFSLEGAKRSVAVGDFDRDGDSDLAMASLDSVRVLLGDGVGGFGAATNFPTGEYSRSVAVGDFDGNGDPDLAVGGFGDVSVLLGDGSGGFGPAGDFGTGSIPTSVAVGDFDGDADADLAVTRSRSRVAGEDVGSDAVSVLLNNRPPTAADDVYETAEDTPLAVAAPGVLSNDTDPDGDVLNTVLVSLPSHGTLIFFSDGSFWYIPDANYSGPDAFSYKVSDGSLESGPALVSLRVTPVNDAPTVTVAAGGACGDDNRSGTIKLTPADVESPPTDLTLSATSSDPSLVPDENLSFAGVGADRTLTASAVFGGSGTAVLTVSVGDGEATGSMTVTLQAGGNGLDTLAGGTGADILLGQNGDDTLGGSAGNDLLCGGNGDDTLDGGEGADTLGGALGVDQLTGGPDADFFSGGAGVDRALDLDAAEGDTQDGRIP